MAIDIDKIIEASDNLDKMSDPSNLKRAPQRTAQPQQPVYETMSLEEFDNLTKPSSNGNRILANDEARKKGAYNLNEELNKINEIRENNGFSADLARRTRLPEGVVESLISNPCLLDPTIAQRQTEGEILARQMMQENGNGNAYDRVKSLMERTDAIDANRASTAEHQFKTKDSGYRAPVPVNEEPSYNVQPTLQTSPIDYGVIKMIVEKVLDEKLAGLKNNLNESIHTPQKPGIVVMEIGKNFRLVDDNDRVYECKMVYLGNRKKKQ